MRLINHTWPDHRHVLINNGKVGTLFNIIKAGSVDWYVFQEGLPKQLT